MLPPDSRATLLEQLRPPLGFRLEHCVGTTFTLHLTSALLPPLAFTSLGLHGSRDPIAIMSALRDVSGRIDLFCQAGQIGVPHQASALMALLESTVHQMRPPRPGHLFHPKVWVCAFRPEECGDEDGDDTPDDAETRYRLLVMSRNLTDDTCWDVIVSLDGSPGTRPYATNRPLADFLLYLPRNTVHPVDRARADRIDTLAEQIRRVQWMDPDGLELAGFHALGVSRSVAPDFNGTRHLVISPFLTDDGIDLAAPTGRISVVSTPEALDQLDPETADHIESAYVVSPDADLREPDESDDNGDDDEHSGSARGARVLTGLHAKVYAVERDRRAHLLVGSANATGPAFTGNVEFLVEFSGRVKDVGVDALLVGNSLGAITVPYPKPFGGVAPSADDEARKRLDRVVRNIAAVPTTATVTGDGTYSITVTTEGVVPLPDRCRATVELHTARSRAAIIESGRPLRAVFNDIALADVTSLLIVTVTSPEGLEDSCVVIARMVGDPPGRFDAIIASQLNTPEKFLRFLALLLGLTGDGTPATILGGTSGGAGQRGYLASGLFEQLLAGLSDNREALASLDAIVTRIAADPAMQHVLPDGFLQLWPVVQQALSTLEGAPA